MHVLPGRETLFRQLPLGTSHRCSRAVQAMESFHAEHLGGAVSLATHLCMIGSDA